MAFMSSFDISGYGLSAQRVRVDTISSNIANANTTRTAEGGPYRRQSVIFKSVDFNKELNKALEGSTNLLKYENPLDEKSGINNFPKQPIMSVVVDKVVRDDKQPTMKYEPNHPDADKSGYVSYPNINPVIEMTDLVEATRSYQANVSAFNSVKSMATSAIEMMRG